MLHVPSCEAFLLLEVFEEGVGVVAVDFHFLETGEFSAVIQFAEVMYRLVGARGLLSKLVAGEVEDGESLSMVLLIEFFQFLILWSESALGGRVDDEYHFVGILLKRHGAAFPVFYGEIVDCFHFALYK